MAAQAACLPAHMTMEAVCRQMGLLAILLQPAVHKRPSWKLRQLYRLASAQSMSRRLRARRPQKVLILAFHVRRSHFMS